MVLQYLERRFRIGLEDSQISGSNEWLDTRALKHSFSCLSVSVCINLVEDRVKRGRIFAVPKPLVTDSYLPIHRQKTQLVYEPKRGL